MTRISLRTMKRYPEKYAWRIAVVGFTARGQPEYYLYTIKEALEVNPNREWKRT